MQFLLNGKAVHIDDARRRHRLLWILRDELNILGPKYGCGIGVCGACTIHLDGTATRACLLTGDDVENRRIVTLEGLAGDQKTLHPVQEAWINANVPQCGYCQNGQVMTAAAMLDENPHITNTEIADVMDRVKCRCGTQNRIRTASHLARDKMKEA